MSSDRWQNVWRMEPEEAREEDLKGLDLRAVGGVRSVVHVPTGLRFVILLDASGAPMSVFSSADPRAGSLLFDAVEFCEDYLKRARDRQVN